MRPADLSCVVRVHRANFPDGFFARLGPTFLTAYYRAYAFGAAALSYVGETDGLVLGYLVGVYMATGIISMEAGWVAILAQIPLLSPFLMLSRVTGGDVGPLEIGVSIVLLVVTIVAALWIAARIYAAGVLLYGQRPGLRAIWRLMRTGM